MGCFSCILNSVSVQYRKPVIRLKFIDSFSLKQINEMFFPLMIKLSCFALKKS